VSAKGITDELVHRRWRPARATASTTRTCARSDRGWPRCRRAKRPKIRRIRGLRNDGTLRPGGAPGW